MKSHKDLQKIQSYLNEINPSLTSEYRCMRCKGDMRKKEVQGACSCSRSHPWGICGSSSDRPIEGLYDGYGLYDMIRYMQDHEDCS